MRISIIIALILSLGCQTQKKDKAQTLKRPEPQVETAAPADIAKKVKTEDSPNIQEGCTAEVCIQMRNHDPDNNSFEIYMVNSVPVAGFQCDLPGVEITGSNGGLLNDNGFDAKNSASRVLAFSMQGKTIPVGMGVLTEISYTNPGGEVCMTDIIFAGIGGNQLSNDTPDCLKLN